MYQVPSDPDLETVLHCLNIFYQKATDLQYDAEDHFTNFASLLEGSEFTNYQSARMAGPQNTLAHFQSCMHRFIRNYCGRNAKEHQYEHFTTHPEDYKKAAKTTIRAHANRLQLIRGYVNSLPPTNDYVISEVQLKKLLLKSCPTAWEKDFDVARLDINTITYEELIDWLENLKSHADREFENTQSKKRRDRDDSAEGNNFN